jgi:PKD repeat protein
MKPFKTFVFILLLLLLSCDTGILEPDAGSLPSGSFLSQVDIKDPFKVSFSASAQNVSSVFWDFGDSLGVATGTSVNHTYSRSGNYTVILTLINKAGVQDVKKQITVSGPEKPIPAFDFSIDDANTPLTVNFNNNTEFGSTYLWNFDDGTTSTDENPSHTYSATGRYSVRLTATGIDGVKQASKRENFFIVNPADFAGILSKEWGLSLYAHSPFDSIRVPSTLKKKNVRLTGYSVTSAEGELVTNGILETCELNDRYVFSNDRNYVCDNKGDARIKFNNFSCGSYANPPTQSWGLTRQDELNMNLTLGTSYIGDTSSGPVYTIMLISPTKLVLQFQRNASGGVKETVQMAFEAK